MNIEIKIDGTDDEIGRAVVLIKASFKEQMGRTKWKIDIKSTDGHTYLYTNDPA